jgi:diguanylate cyclase (GGDEF)-like protein/putative nucleotidyltransferase with HDIG domain
VPRATLGLEARLSLRLKIYLLMGTTLLVAVAVVFFVSQTVFMSGFVSVENAQMREQVKLAQAAMGSKLLELSAATRAYSSGEAVSAALDTEDPSSGDAVFPTSFFSGFNANAAVLLDKNGQILFDRGFDPRYRGSASLPSGLAGYISPGATLAQQLAGGTEFAGIVSLPDGPMLLDSQPVRSTVDGQKLGDLVVGRRLDAAALTELAAQTRLELTVLPLSASDVPSSVQQAVSADGAQAGQQVFVVPQSDQTAAGYAVLRDVFGEPAAVLRVLMPRAISAEGGYSLRYFMLSLLALVLVFGLVLDQLIERSLFRRLAVMTATIRRVRPGKVGFTPIAVSGHDELDLLAETINAGFSQVEATRTQQEAQALNLASTLDELEGRHQDLKKAHVRLQHLQRVSASLGSSLEIKDALAQLETAALDMFEADEIWLLRARPDQQQLVGLGAFFRQKAGCVRLPSLFGCDHPDSGLSQQANRLLKAVFQGSEAIFIDSIKALTIDEQFRLFGGSLPDLDNFQSLAVVPLIADDSTLGLAISASTSPGEFSADRRSTILLFAAQVAQALKNTRLVEEIKALGETDSLSGLYNRRRALIQLENEIRRAERYQGKFSLLIADIDNFKLFNDTYGHPVGDEIIRRVANILYHRSRASDLVARFGGDEFMLILPEAFRADAKKVADHMRSALAAQPYIAPDGTRIPLRMSFGASSYPEDGLDAAGLIAVADANLYESKRWGGDTVTVRPEPISGEAVDSRAFSTLDSLVSAVDNKDHYTRRHSAQVAEHTALIATRLGLTAEQHETLRVASLLHDVGKIGVPDRILRKPGSLTPKEQEYMRQHPMIGSMMISQHLPESTDVRDAVASHHERWDGTGYPAYLRGEEIPLLSRILAVADAYSAMTTDRPYHAALDSQSAVDRLVKGSGIQFDPDVVTAFIACLNPAESAVA